MRTLRLARIAAEAEGLRLRRQVQRTVVRVVTGVIGLMFLGWAVVFAQVAAWLWLRDSVGWSAAGAAAAIAGADLVVAGVLALAMARSSPGRVEREALQVRRQALASAVNSLGWRAMVVPAVRLLLDLVRRR